MDKDGSKSEGSKILFDKLGKSAYIEKIKNDKKLLLTDTTKRRQHYEGLQNG